MKILIVNLLRLGDVIALAPAVKAIRSRYPDAEIHMLVNSNFTSAAAQIHGVDRVLVFERDRLQSSCVEADRPMFEAYDWMQAFVDEVSAEGYELLYNFTHNRLSGWLCGLIDSKEKIGLVLDGSGAVSYGSSWIRHLNQQVDFEDRESFNHTDIFLGACGGTEIAQSPTFFDSLLRESKKGREEASSLMGPEPRRFVLLQISTSDEKKDWGDERFLELARQILESNLDISILVLGAPAERARVEVFCESLPAYKHRLKPAIASLSGVVSLLESAEVLVTGDTSIKHFGSASPARVVEVVAGSADAYRTGSWKAGDFIISSQEPCAPCGHSEICHRSSHACAIAVKPSAVAAVVNSLLNNDQELSTLKTSLAVCRELFKNTNLFLVDRSEGPASLVPILSGDLSDTALALCIERSARRLTLELRDGRLDKNYFGSEILKAHQSLRNRFPTVGSLELRHALNDGERRLRHAEGILNSLHLQLNRLQESIQDAHRMREMVTSIAVLRSRLQLHPWTRFIAEPLVQIIEDDRSAPFAKFRKMSDAVKDLEVRLKTGLKLVRGLEIHVENEIEKLENVTGEIR